MSVLLVGLAEDLAGVLIERLLAAGDEVRVLESDPGLAATYRARGAHVAVGPPDDEDLVERAATNVRTLVVGPRVTDIRPLLSGSITAQVDRIVGCYPKPDEATRRLLEDSTLSYVLLATGSPRLLKRRGLVPELVAQAIDAADDLAGHPRLQLDLREPSSWEPLRLRAP